MPDLFLQLTTSVSAIELETMRNLTSQGWPQAENIANFYLRIMYSLVDNDDKLRQSFASLQLWPKIQGKCRYLSLQGGYTLSDTIPRLRKLLMRQPVDNLRYNETIELLNLFVDCTDYPSNFRKSAPGKIKHDGRSVCKRGISEWTSQQPGFGLVRAFEVFVGERRSEIENCCSGCTT